MPKYFFAAMALVFQLAGTAQAQQVIEDNYTIRGYVIVPSIHHDERFEVFLMTKDGDQIIDRTNVGISNFYSFTNLTKGYYDLVVRLNGFKEARVSVRAGLGNAFGTAGDYSVSPADSNVLIPRPLDINISLESVSGDNVAVSPESKYTNEILDEYARGIEEMTRAHPDLAVAHLEKVVQEIPDFYDARFNLGLVYQSLSRRSEAEMEFRKAHELNADSARPLLALGRLFVEEADIEILAESRQEVVQPILSKARDTLTQAVMVDPKLASGFYYLGAVNFRTASYTSAAKDLQHALELDPALSAARITLINVYVEQKQWNEALDNADAFLLENPSSPYRQQVAATRASIVRRLQLAR